MNEKRFDSVRMKTRVTEVPFPTACEDVETLNGGSVLPDSAPTRDELKTAQASKATRRDDIAISIDC
jgi:hypothetical protein